jgi:hypothetical protein
MTKITSLPEATTITNAATLIVVDQGVTKKISYQTFRATALKGDTGSTGTQGLIGPRGPTGTVATIEVGTVSVNTASLIPSIVAISTTTGSAVITTLNFEFPPGPKGDTGTYIIDVASTTTIGGVIIGSGIDIDGAGVISIAPPDIEPATVFSLGGVIIGDGIEVDEFGEISVNTGTPYVLQTATSVTLGGVKIGAGIGISDGVISVTTGAFALQTATADALGGVKIGSGIGVTDTGTISVSIASTTTVGGVRIGSGIDINGSGIISVSTGVSVAESLTGSILAASITTSSLTTLGTLLGLTVQGTTTLQGITTLQQTPEVYTNLAVSSSTAVHDCSASAVFVINNPASNWTANFTNVSSSTGRVISVAVLVNQGAIPYIPSSVQINNLSQTLNWQGNVTPIGNANKKDLVNFTFVSPASTGTSSYTVLGSLASYG